MFFEKGRPEWITLLKAGYVCVVVLLTLLIISTPYLVKGDFTLGKDLVLVEEIIECSLIALMLLAAYSVIRVYHYQMQKAEIHARSVEAQLGDAIKYIGKVNVQIAAIKSNFSSMRKYPQIKADFDKTLNILTQSALGIANVDWIEFRIIHLDTHKMIREHHEARAGSEVPRHNTSNRAIIEGKRLPGYSIVSSEWENLTVKAFCILPVERLTDNQEVFLKDLVGELEMLFVIFTSQYYQKEYFKNQVEPKHKA